MKNAILNQIKSKHKRCFQGLGTFETEIFEGRNQEEAKQFLKELKKEKKITSRNGAFGIIYNYNENPKNEQ